MLLRETRLLSSRMGLGVQSRSSVAKLPGPGTMTSQLRDLGSAY